MAGGRARMGERGWWAGALGPDLRAGRALLAGLALLNTGGLSGCGPTCADIAADHAARAAAPLTGAPARPPVEAEAGPPDLALRVSASGVAEAFAVLLPAEARQLGLDASDPVGAALGGIAVRLTELRLVPGPRGAALALTVALSLGGAERVALRGVVDLAPRVETLGGRVAVALPFDPAQLRDLAVDLPLGSALALAEAVHGRLPAAVQERLPRLLLAALLPAALSAASGAAWALARDGLLDRLPGPVLSWTLPEGVPAPHTVALAMTGAGRGETLTLSAWTEPPVRPSPAWAGAPGAGEPGAGEPQVDGAGEPGAGEPQVEPGAARLAVSGPLLVGLAGAGIRSGAVPGRYDPEGRADAAGPVRVLPGWSAGARPARLEVWRWPDTCVRATLAGVPRASVAAGALAVGLEEVARTAVSGPPLDLLAAWWSDSVGRAWSTRLAGAGALQVGGATLAWRLESARFDAWGLHLGGVLTAGLAPRVGDAL